MRKLSPILRECLARKISRCVRLSLAKLVIQKNRKNSLDQHKFCGTTEVWTACCRSLYFGIVRKFSPAYVQIPSGLPVGRCEKIIPIHAFPLGNVVGMTCGLRGVRLVCATSSCVLCDIFSGMKGKSVMRRHGVPVCRWYRLLSFFYR